MFKDRRDAGRQLAAELTKLDLPDPVVLALPRGGVAVAVEIAKALRCPLDLVLVRKIGSPGHAELAAGAVVDGDMPVLVRNEDVIRHYDIDETWLESERRHQLDEIERRRALYLGSRPRAGIAGRTAIVVDDGIATGATVRAALQAVRACAPREIVLAVPVAAPEVLTDLAATCDRTVCLDRNPHLSAVGQAYRDFTQVEDEEVIAMLAEVPGG
ncbi:MAG: phosphoribosyltransferase [Geminicoccaceae bacterium]